MDYVFSNFGLTFCAVYQEVGVALNASPSKLGTLTFTRALVQALFSPLAGFLAMHYDRGTVIGIGTLIWAGATLVVGLSTTYFQAMIGRAITGVRKRAPFFLELSMKRNALILDLFGPPFSKYVEPCPFAS